MEELYLVGLEKGVDVNTQLKIVVIALCLASCRALFGMLEIKTTIDINDVQLDGQTLLQLAVQGGDARLVELLLIAGADKNSCNSLRLTPLTVAVQEGHRSVVSVLLSPGHEKNRNMFSFGSGYGRKSLLSIATAKGHTEIVRLLKSTGDVGRTPLHMAAQEGHEKMVRFLLSNSVEVDCVLPVTGETPLLYAARNGHVRIVELLLKAGQRATVQNRMFPLKEAVLAGHTDVVKMLLAEDPEITRALLLCNHSFNHSQLSYLHLAALEGHARVVEALLDAGADMNSVATGLTTPLHLAVQKGHQEVVDLLVRRGVDLNVCRNNGDLVQAIDAITPLHDAASGGFEGIANRLLSAGAKRNPVNSRGETPLYYAACLGHFTVVGELLYRTADRDIAAANGETPLMVAQKNGHDEVAQRLEDRRQYYR